MNACDMSIKYLVISTQFGICLVWVLVCLFGFLSVEIHRIHRIYNSNLVTTVYRPIVKVRPIS